MIRLFELLRKRSTAVAVWGLALMLSSACSGGTTEAPDVVAPTDTAVDAGVAIDAATDAGVATDAVADSSVVRDPLVVELIAQGKERLSSGESLSAMDSFDRALVLAPDDPEATWGLVLARFQTTVAMFSSLPGLANYKVDPDDDAGATKARAVSDWPDHESTLGATIDGLYHAAIEQQQRLDALKSMSGTSFRLDGGLPLAFADLPMMTLCCEWDVSDAYAISSFNHLLLAFVSLLGSQQTDANLVDLEDVFKDSPGIGNMFTSALEGYPALFTLLPEDGEEIWRSMKDALLASTEDALEAARLMAEEDASSDSVATLSDDEHPYLVLHGQFPNGADHMLVLWDGNTASLKDVVERANANLSGSPDALLGLETEALVPVGVLVDIVNRTVGIDALLGSFGFELPDIVGGLLGVLDKDNPEQLVGLLGTLTNLLGIPAGTVFVDLAGFLDSPYDLRDLFPNYGPEPGSTLQTFTRSFECIKGGVLVAAGDEGDELVVFVQDPSLAGDSASVTVRSYASEDLSGDETDQEELALEPVAGFGGLFTATLPLVGSADPVSGDDALAVSDTGSIGVAYRSAEIEGRDFTFGGALAAGVYPWDYGAACDGDAAAWDGTHFGQPEFADAVEISAPGESTLVSPLAADGTVTRTPFMAFKSPSFNHLVWIKDGDSVSEATQASFSTLFAGVMAALEAF